MVISNLLKLSLQFVTYFCFLLYYSYTTNAVHVQFVHLLLLPVIILILAMTAMGVGIIISSFTYKYKDLNMLVGIGITILMYATPIMYPSSSIPKFYKPYLAFNPISPLIEFFRFSCTGHGSYSFAGLLYSFVFALVMLVLGIFVFNRTEKIFMDTI
jgi:lipopolysaccharide transport system permease protein